MLPPQATPINGVQGTIADQPDATHLPDGTRYIQTDGIEQYVDSGTWVDVGTGGGGSGTVTDVTSIDDSVLVTDPTTTPDLSVQDSPAVGGIEVTGTPTVGDVLTATSPTTADWEPPTGGSSLEVSDGTTSVLDVVEILLTGAVVTDGGSGVAEVTVTGGTTTPFATFLGQLKSPYDPSGGGVLFFAAPSITVPFDPVAITGGSVNLPLTFPTLVYTAGVIATFQTWQLTGIDTTNDTYEIEVDILVTDANGNNSLVLTGTAVANAGSPGDSAGIVASGLTVVGTVGSDLSYDSGTGEISSALGGIYSIVSVWNGGWS